MCTPARGRSPFTPKQLLLLLWILYCSESPFTCLGLSLKRPGVVAKGIVSYVILRTRLYNWRSRAYEAGGSLNMALDTHWFFIATCIWCEYFKFWKMYRYSNLQTLSDITFLADNCCWNRLLRSMLLRMRKHIPLEYHDIKNLAKNGVQKTQCITLFSRTSSVLNEVRVVRIHPL